MGVLGLEGTDIVVLAAAAVTGRGMSFKRGGRRRQWRRREMEMVDGDRRGIKRGRRRIQF